MRFDIITIFPESLRGYFNSSILGRAQKDKKIKINLHNLRDFADNKHKKLMINLMGRTKGNGS